MILSKTKTAYPVSHRTLGAQYAKEATVFNVWAPTHKTVTLALYDSAQAIRRTCFPMRKNDDGTFEVRIPGDLHGKYYTYLLEPAAGASIPREVTDPYAVSSAKNSARSAVIDLARTDPAGFRDSEYIHVLPSDAILYELHIGDFTYSMSSENPYRGKYLSFTQADTKRNGVTTGIAHLKELGITHVHLMPLQDFLTVDESFHRFGAADNYNWGYDPELFNVPEGSYSMDPDDPTLRIREVKRMVQSLHEAGIGVVLDVVYNHTYRAEGSNFNQLVPNYYYRMRNGHFTNGSGCGNEMKTENPMVRKFIVDSLLYWQREYKIDGFRFDLMALIDRETVAEITRSLRAVNPYTLLYGEPWAATMTSLDEAEQTTWFTQNHPKGGPFALFNAAFRDAIRGDNDGIYRGYVQGIPAARKAVETGLLGSIDYDAVHKAGLDSPVGTVNYFNAHDNLIFEDKLIRTVGQIPETLAMTRLAFGILLTAQGIPFFHAGNEFRRDKKMCENSYCAPYSVNAIDWDKKSENLPLVNYVRDLIALRKRYPVFRLQTTQEIRARVRLFDSGEENVILLLYRVQEGMWILCVHNNAWSAKTLNWGTMKEELADSFSYRCIFDGSGACEGSEVRVTEKTATFSVAPISTTIFRIARAESEAL